MINNTPLLDAMLADQEKQPPLYRPGAYWRGYQQRIREALKTSGMQNFRANSAVGKGWTDVPNLDPSDLWPHKGLHGRLQHALIKLPVFRSIVAEYRNAIANHFQKNQTYLSAYYDLHFGDWLRGMAERYQIPDTLGGGSQVNITIDGVTYSKKYIDLLLNIYNFSQKIDLEKIELFVEIGGGFGANTHLLLELFPNIRKVIYVDIPLMLYVSTEYLRQYYGDAVIDYSCTREQERIMMTDYDTREIFCLCPWQLERIDAQADLFWNCASFSEMTADIVDNYAVQIKRLLGPDSAIALILTGAAGREDKTGPERVIAAFGEEFAFETFDPEIEHERYPVHAFAHRRVA